MPIKLWKYPDSPIIISTYDGVVRCQDVKAALIEVDQFIRSFEATASLLPRRYYVIDVRTVDMDISELGCVMDLQLKGQAGTLSDPNLRVTFVGTNFIIRTFQKFLLQHGVDRSMLSIYLRMEDALVALQARITADSTPS